MSNFEGNNNMKAFEVFKNRLMYSGLAFSEDGETINMVPDMTRNLWFIENMFYGRIREKSGDISIIAPKSENLISCKNTGENNPVKALDFVVDAHQNLLFEYEKNRIRSYVSEGSTHLSDLLVYAGAKDVSRGHKKNITEMNKRFIFYSKHSDIKSATDKVFSFDDFVPFFMEFLRRTVKTFPVTISSYLISKQSTPMSSGLCLEVAQMDHSDDGGKSQFFLNDDNFQIYRILAANSGFAIDKNAPWRMIADIQSAQMLEFAANRVPGITTAEDVLDYYFEDVRDRDDELEDFKVMVYDAYGAFLVANPVVYEKSVGPEGKIAKNINRRTREGFASIDARLGDDFWYDKFITIKNIEFDLGYSETEMNKIKNNVVDLDFSLDRARAMGYIKKRMTPIISSEGSLVYRMFSLNNKNISGSPKKDVQAIARSLNKKTY